MDVPDKAEDDIRGLGEPIGSFLGHPVYDMYCRAKKKDFFVLMNLHN